VQIESAGSAKAKVLADNQEDGDSGDGENGGPERRENEQVDESKQRAAVAAHSALLLRPAIGPVKRQTFDHHGNDHGRKQEEADGGHHKRDRR
jgi:hypothetical protein